MKEVIIALTIIIFSSLIFYAGYETGAVTKKCDGFDEVKAQNYLLTSLKQLGDSNAPYEIRILGRFFNKNSTISQALKTYESWKPYSETMLRAYLTNLCT